MISIPLTSRERLVERARLLAWIGLGWHVSKPPWRSPPASSASSVALVGFGADSLIEAAAGIVVHLADGRRAFGVRRAPSGARSS